MASITDVKNSIIASGLIQFNSDVPLACNALKMEHDARLGVFYDRYEPLKYFNKKNYIYNGISGKYSFYKNWLENEVFTFFKEDKEWLVRNYSLEYGALLHELVGQISGAIFAGSNFQVNESPEIKAVLDSVFDGDFRTWLKDELLPFLLFNPNGYLAVVEGHEKTLQPNEKYKACVELVRVFDVLFENDNVFMFQEIENQEREIWTLARGIGQSYEKHNGGENPYSWVNTFINGGYFETLPVIEVPSLESDNIGRSYFSDYVSLIEKLIKNDLEFEWERNSTHIVRESVEETCRECNGRKTFENADGESENCRSCKGTGVTISASPRSVRVYNQGSNFADNKTPLGTRFVEPTSSLLDTKFRIITEQKQDVRKRLFLPNNSKNGAETAESKRIDYNGFVNLCKNISGQLYKLAKFAADYALGIELNNGKAIYAPYDTQIQAPIKVEITSLRDTLAEYKEAQDSKAQPVIISEKIKAHFADIFRGNELMLKKYDVLFRLNPYHANAAAELVTLSAIPFYKEMYSFAMNYIDMYIETEGENAFMLATISDIETKIKAMYDSKMTQ